MMENETVSAPGEDCTMKRSCDVEFLVKYPPRTTEAATKPATSTGWTRGMTGPEISRNSASKEPSGRTGYRSMSTST
eukprot:133321-Rhodomonas_salina.1